VSLDTALSWIVPVASGVSLCGMIAYRIFAKEVAAHTAAAARSIADNDAARAEAAAERRRRAIARQNARSR
jgi:hypothetical protein